MLLLLMQRRKNGIRYGFTAFSVNKGTLRVTDAAKAKQVISDLRDSSDIVIVSMHIGAVLMSLSTIVVAINAQLLKRRLT